MKVSEVWVVDDDESIRWVLKKAFLKSSINVRLFSDGREALKLADECEPEVVVSDIKMPDIDGLDLLRKMKEIHSSLPIIIMTAYADLDKAVESFSSGAFEYLPKPFDIEEMLKIVKRAKRKRKDKESISDSKIEFEQTEEIVGSSSAMQSVFRIIGRLSSSDMTVLVTGESGTGKEIVARSLHKHSPRKNGPLIAINAAAIPQDLLESELFGHEKGAFTGADSKRVGRFEQANTGTLFLDEIGDMPAHLQTRLLRVLADGELYRVGGIEPIFVDVRVIAATHQNLEEMVAEGLFREDLFHRLNVIRLELPPLRERIEDVEELSRFFLEKAAKELNIPSKRFSDKALDKLRVSVWPGNVRQLQNICKRLTALVPTLIIDFDDLPDEILNDLPEDKSDLTTWETGLEQWAMDQLSSGKNNILKEAEPIFEKILIKAALSATEGKRQEAARLLGVGRNTLTKKLISLNIENFND
ncbi:MAG: nitrogen regulation protein NR(I) [Pseudomonadota bacterium]|nr:nitrogen regulation protein NR(I) [Pseudomonadota bacterium]